MSDVAEADSISEEGQLEFAVDQVIAAHDGDVRLAIRMLILMQKELETKVSQGFIRGVWHGRFSVTTDSNICGAFAGSSPDDEKSEFIDLQFRGADSSAIS